MNQKYSKRKEDLIPKTSNADRTKDFRSISCVNTLYKVISRLLTNRLQEILYHVISPSQSAFIKGRLLSENVLLATEIIHGYNRRNISRRGMLKVDLRKAFDSIKWDFILSTLRAIQIPEIFISWIAECITTPTFSVSVNGVSGGYYKSTKGLRQGDPLSPYLFVLAMEVFSRLLSSRFDTGYIAYHPKAEDINISHLIFADDVMIFFDGESASLHAITETLEDFSGWSGLHVNKDKSELFVAGVNELEAVEVTSYDFPVVKLPIRYLGLPLMHRTLRVSEYNTLLHKLAGTFRAWAVKMLSYAGRLQLLSSVINGGVNFWMSTFILPKGCVKKIESMCSKFLWGGDIDTRSTEKVAWKAVCLPKLEGGLGLRSFSEWNKVLCLRFIWLLFSGTNSLWVQWQKHHHLRSSSFWALERKNTDSASWNSILALRPLAQQFIKCKVINGTSAKFWFDTWTPFGQLIKFLGDSGPRDTRIPLSASVRDATNDTGWRLAQPRSDNALALHIHLTTINLPLEESTTDTFHWIIDSKDCKGFSSSKTWEAVRPRARTKGWARSVWFKGAIPRHVFNMWLANLNRLPTKVRLASWGLNISTTCCLCSIQDETRDHLFLQCSYSNVLWNLLFARLDPNHASFFSWEELLSWIRVSTTSAPSTLKKLATQALIYNVWRQRNAAVHLSGFAPVQTTFNSIDRDIRNTISARRHRRKFSLLMQLWIR